jgi:hypothetical protein
VSAPVAAATEPVPPGPELPEARTPEPALPAPATAGPVAPADRPWRRAWLIGTSTWLAAVATYLIVTLLSWMIEERPGPAMSRLYQVWDHWDTGYYMRISRIGYTADRPDTHAFFPLFPILLRGVDTVVPGPTLISSLVLSNLCCIGALVVLHRFAAREVDPATADRLLLFLMAFPTAFFLSAGYNGSLYLLLSVSALYCLRSGRFVTAGAFGAFASATRLTGVLLVLPFVLEYARQNRWRAPGWLRWPGRGPVAQRAAVVLRPDAAGVLLIPVGVAAFATYCWVRFGDPLDFAHAQEVWGKHFAPPWVGFEQAVHMVSRQPMVLYQAGLHNMIDIGFGLGSIVLLVLCVAGPWRLRRDQLFLVVYAAASLLTVLMSPAGGLFPMMGIPRYALELIPNFLLLARLGAHRAFERIYLLPAVGLQAVLLLAFLRNIWVA